MLLYIRVKKARGGEGSRGGKVIGHTRSGKPIYSNSSNHHSEKNFTKDDHFDAHAVHAHVKSRIKGGGASSERHRANALHHGEKAGVDSGYLKENFNREARGTAASMRARRAGIREGTIKPKRRSEKHEKMKDEISSHAKDLIE